MKKLLMLAAAAAAILPMTAQAETVNSATGEIALKANSNNTCGIRAITKGSRGPGTYTPSTNTTVNNTAVVKASLDFGNGLMNQTNATTNGTVAESEHDFYLKAFCNYAGHNVSLKSLNGGLTNTAATLTNGTFNKRIPYKAEIRDWNSGPFATLNANGTGANPSTNSTQNTITATSEVDKAVNHDKGSIRITTVADLSNPLLQGDYTDVLTVKLGEAF